MLEAAHAWLAGVGIVPSGPVVAIHERPWSTVLRVPTADGDLFLKQEAPVQAFEVALTVELAERWPDRVPEVVAADLERAWLLLRDGGTRLRDGAPLEALPVALRLYGELQVGEAAHVDELLALGLPDVRLPVLRAAYEPFLAHEHGLPADEAARLQSLAPRFHELCDELEPFGLPDSIQHDDLHDANVFVRDGRVAIYDWGDSSVAPPLFSWLKPLRFAEESGLDPEPLLAAYLSPWSAYAPEERLREAMRAALPVGSFAYAYQYRRQLEAMDAQARSVYAAYMPEQLRALLARLEDRGA